MLSCDEPEPPVKFDLRQCATLAREDDELTDRRPTLCSSDGFDPASGGLAGHHHCGTHAQPTHTSGGPAGVPPTCVALLVCAIMLPKSKTPSVTTSSSLIVSSRSVFMIASPSADDLIKFIRRYWRHPNRTFRDCHHLGSRAV